MNEPSNQPRPDAGAINKQIKTAVQSHRVKLRVLTSAAFVFGFLAIATSVALVWGYLFMVLPKQRQMLMDAEYPALKTPAGSTAEPRAVQDAVKRIDQTLGTEVLMTHVISVGVSIVCIAVGVLGSGTLILLTVVILNRRVTLNQINVSLTQISKQLQDLQAARQVTFQS